MLGDRGEGKKKKKKKVADHDLISRLSQICDPCTLVGCVLLVSRCAVGAKQQEVRLKLQADDA